MKIYWDVTANATNTVMFELLVAARTDEKLRATLQDVLAEYATYIHDTAKALPGADQFPGGHAWPRWWRSSRTPSTAPRSSVPYCRSPRSKPSSISC